MHYSCRQLTYAIPANLAPGDTVSFGRTDQRYTHIETLVSDKGTTIVWESKCRKCSAPFRIYTGTVKTSGVCRNCNLHREPKGHSGVDKDNEPSKPRSAAPVVNKAKKEKTEHPAPRCPANCLTPAMRASKGATWDKLVSWLFTYSPLERNEARYTTQQFREALEAFYASISDTSLDDML